VVNLEGDRLVIEGPIMMQNVTAIYVAGQPHIEQGQAAMLDLAKVTDIDSSAVALVLCWLRQAAKAGKMLKVTNVPSSFKTLADLYGVSSFVEPI